MPHTFLSKFKRRVANSTRYQFWVWQAGFWIFMSVVSFFTLTLWYRQFSMPYMVHTVFQAVVGLALSLALYWIFRRMWDKPLFFRLAMSLAVVLVISLIWTVIRMQAFIWLTVEQNVWADFGGWYFGGIFIFLFWAGIFYGLRYYQLQQYEHRILLQAEAQTRDEQMKRMRAQSEARDAQIKMLRYQLNPHFLCNTLNAINALVEAQQTETAQSMTVSLSRFLRYSLDNNPDTKVALENEVKALYLYLDIEKTRFGERLRLDFNISDHAARALVPSLLLQPIIENSMKHAIAPSENGGTISLIATRIGDRLHIEMSDSGEEAKISSSKLNSSKGRGVGLRNTDQRLEALYDNRYKFDLKIMPKGGLKTIIDIPYERAAESAHSSTRTRSLVN